MSETVSGFDEPKYTSGRKGFPESLKDGAQELRILPSMDGTGEFVRTHTCHYGYGTKMSNSDKEIPNPFYCVEEGKFVAGKFVVLAECPECREIRRIEGEKQAIEVDMKRKGASEEEIRNGTDSQTRWLRKHNRDFKYYVNVKDATGRFFTVKLPSKKVWKPIMSIIERYRARKYPIDAIAASQGLWFRVTKSGKGFGTDYAAELVTEEVYVPGQAPSESAKLGPLTADDARKAKESCCIDLQNVGINRLTREQVARLVESRGDPNIVQAIFAASQVVTSDITTRGDREVEEEYRAPTSYVPAASAPVPQSEPPSAPAPAPAAAPSRPEVPESQLMSALAAECATMTPSEMMDRVRAIMAKSALNQQKKSEAPAPAILPPPAPAPAPAATPAPVVSTTPPPVQAPAAPPAAKVPAPTAGATSLTPEQAFMAQFNAGGGF